MGDHSVTVSDAIAVAIAIAIAIAVAIAITGAIAAVVTITITIAVAITVSGFNRLDIAIAITGVPGARGHVVGSVPGGFLAGLGLRGLVL